MLCSMAEISDGVKKKGPTPTRGRAKLFCGSYSVLYATVHGCYDSNVTVLEVAQQILTELAAMQAQLNAMQTVLARIDVAVEGTPMTFVLAVT